MRLRTTYNIQTGAYRYVLPADAEARIEQAVRADLEDRPPHDSLHPTEGRLRINLLLELSAMGLDGAPAKLLERAINADLVRYLYGR